MSITNIIKNIVIASVVTSLSIIMLNNYATKYVYIPPIITYKRKNYYKKYFDKNKNEYFNIKNNNSLISCVKIKPLKYKTNKKIIFSHGNASDIDENLIFLNVLSDMYGVEIICYDYPGYGMSSGIPSENECYNSLKTVIKYFKNDDLILCGYSLGTGITIDYVSKHKWKNDIILISPYKSIARIVYDNPIMDIIHYQNNFCSISKLNKIKCNVKIFHSSNDELINVSHGQYICKNLKNNKYNITIINNYGHNDVINYFMQNIDNDFMDILK
jgi:pimeloyl-ACP methyl ester carboxylesterase